MADDCAICEGIRTLEAANDLLSRQYVAEFNRKFQVSAAHTEGVSTLSAQGHGPDLLARVRAHSLTGIHRTSYNVVMQSEPADCRGIMAGCPGRR